MISSCNTKKSSFYFGKYELCFKFNAYPAGANSDLPLPPVYRQSSVHFDQALYGWLNNFKFLSWYPNKMVMDSTKNKVGLNTSLSKLLIKFTLILKFVRVVDLESVVPQWVGASQGTLDSFMWASYPASLRNIGGSTEAHARAWNNAQRGTWGLPPLLKLECYHIIFTVLVKKIFKKVQTEEMHDKNIINYLLVSMSRDNLFVYHICLYTDMIDGPRIPPVSSLYLWQELVDLIPSKLIKSCFF